MAGGALTSKAAAWTERPCLWLVRFRLDVPSERLRCEPDHLAGAGAPEQGAAAARSLFTFAFRRKSEPAGTHLPPRCLRSNGSEVAALTGLPVQSPEGSHNDRERSDGWGSG